MQLELQLTLQQLEATVLYLDTVSSDSVQFQQKKNFHIICIVLH